MAFFMKETLWYDSSFPISELCERTPISSTDVLLFTSSELTGGSIGVLEPPKNTLLCFLLMVVLNDPEELAEFGGGEMNVD